MALNESAPQPLDYAPTEAAPIMAPSSPRFLYRWHAEQWELVTVDGKPVLVPQLSLLILEGGVNGVHSVGAHQGASGQKWTEGAVLADAIRASTEKGFKHLPPDLRVERKHLPDGVDAGPLLRSTPVVHEGAVRKRHHDAFEVAISRPGQPARLVYNSIKFHAWLAAQVEAGLFGAPDATVIGDLRAPMERELQRKRALALPADLREDLVAGVRARIEALETAAKPAEPPKRGKVAA